MKINVISNTATVIPPLVFAAAQNFAYPSGNPGGGSFSVVDNYIVANQVFYNTILTMIGVFP